MSKLVLGARVLFGMIFLVFGVNSVLHFLPEPDMTPQGKAFIDGLVAAPYLFPIVKAIEVLAGGMVLSGMFVPLALILIAPITINILLYHVFLDPQGLAMAIALVILQLIIAWGYWPSFQGVLARQGAKKV
ncbi:MAG: acyltransferase [Spirochaetota bacterium]